MRIIAGKLKGRIIAEAHGHKTHPMSEKIRGALFNALGELDGLTVLDAFAGTGAVSIEAISRGSSSVLSIDSDSEAINCINKNVQSLDLEDVIKVIQANITSWSELNSNKTFDVVIADPPYDKVNTDLLQKVANHTSSGGVFVVSLPTTLQLALSKHFTLLSSKNYGDASLYFYRRIS